LLYHISEERAKRTIESFEKVAKEYRPEYGKKLAEIYKEYIEELIKARDRLIIPKKKYYEIREKINKKLLPILEKIEAL